MQKINKLATSLFFLLLSAIQPAQGDTIPDINRDRTFLAAIANALARRGDSFDYVSDGKSQKFIVEYGSGYEITRYMVGLDKFSHWMNQKTSFKLLDLTSRRGHQSFQYSVRIKNVEARSPRLIPTFENPASESFQFTLTFLDPEELEAYEGAPYYLPRQKVFKPSLVHEIKQLAQKYQKISNESSSSHLLSALEFIQTELQGPFGGLPAHLIVEIIQAHHLLETSSENSSRGQDEAEQYCSMMKGVPHPFQVGTDEVNLCQFGAAGIGSWTLYRYGTDLNAQLKAIEFFLNAPPYREEPIEQSNLSTGAQKPPIPGGEPAVRRITNPDLLYCHQLGGHFIKMTTSSRNFLNSCVFPLNSAIESHTLFKGPADLGNADLLQALTSIQAKRNLFKMNL